MYTEAQIAKFKGQVTPFFWYDLVKLEQVLKVVKAEADKHGFIVHYAIKANANDPILEMIKEHGFGADCVTGNEIKKSINIGFRSESIAFAGVGKSDKEITYALQQGIFSLNCESKEELEVVNDLAGRLKKNARVALRINPDVNPNTHQYITTGLEENKFGINTWELEDVLEILKRSKNIELTGLHFHIGSQIRDLEVFKHLCTRVNEMQKWFEDRNVSINHVNVGGGLGVDYENPDEPLPDFVGFFRLFKDFLELRPGQELHFELGRALVASCGDLISKVLFVKKGVKTNFAILDAGMTELIRPALYQSYHSIQNITANGSAKHKYDVVGPICESSDCFGKAVILPETKRGDLIAIRTTGAYGEVMSSSYNLRDKAGTLYSENL